LKGIWLMELRMSRKERDRLKVMAARQQGRMSQVEGARVLGLSVRQFRRLERRYERHGDAGLVHTLRGRVSNRQITPEVREAALAAVRSDYADFGPTLAAEYLAEREGIVLSRETLRKWMILAGLWKGSRPKRPHRRHRPRRPCRGELVQMDTSVHDWFEGRGEGPVVLITMVDDATGWVFERFFDADSTATNMEMLRDYIARWGRPRALYTDWASHFKHTATAKERRRAEQIQTQIERALEALDIELIAAGSPQAKGRVERRFGLEQDRLVKALRLEGISTLQAANAFLEQRYLPRSNARFAIAPACEVDVHRSAEDFDLDGILSTHHTRCVAPDYTVQFLGQTLQIEPGELSRRTPGMRVVVQQRLDETLRLQCRACYLKFRPIAPHEHRSGRDRLGGSSLGLRPPSEPPKAKPHIPPPDHPWRRTFLKSKKEDISTLR
jgi:hypothetical protein